MPEDPEWAWFTLGLVCVGVIWVVLGCLGRELGCPGGQAVTSSGMIGAWRVLVPQLGCPGGHDSAWYGSAWSGIYHLGGSLLKGEWGGKCEHGREGRGEGEREHEGEAAWYSSAWSGICHSGRSLLRGEWGGVSP